MSNEYQKILTKLEEMDEKLDQLLNAAPAADAGDADTSGEGTGDADSEETTVDMPDNLEDLNALSKEDTMELCTKLGIDTDGKKLAAIKELLATAMHIGLENDNEVDEDAANELADALGVEKGKKLRLTIANLREYLGEAEKATTEDAGDADADGADGADDDDDKKKKTSEDDEEDDAGDDDDKKKKGDDDAGDDEEEVEDEGVNRPLLAKKMKLPDEAIMQKRLAAFNKAAGSKAINVKKLGVEAAYRKLGERLFNADGELAKWAVPYVAYSQYCCCGLSLKEIDVKNVERAGQCKVTGKQFEIDDDNTFTEI